MHIGQLFLELSGFVNLKRVVPRLPEAVSHPKTDKIVGSLLAIPTPDAEAAHSPPTVQEASKLAAPRKPNDRVDMIRHDDIADAPTLKSLEL
jgi:hypothetical protein